MAEINELLQKYFNGETSLQEEEQLKLYFKSENISTEHEPYKVLFGVFESESKVTYPAASLTTEDLGRRQTRFFRMKVISLSGMAATVLLAVWLFNSAPSGNSDYVIMNGKRVDNSELAQELAINQMNKVNDILAKSLKPMNSIQKVKQSLEPVRKISTLNPHEIN
ncbi:MAG: hypothetical protein H6Q20_2576 [Bacteroidetes bacterium]|nr:hypothetical protein [Bacteroidota bacterium]